MRKSFEMKNLTIQALEKILGRLKTIRMFVFDFFQYRNTDFHCLSFEDLHQVIYNVVFVLFCNTQTLEYTIIIIAINECYIFLLS